VLPLIYKYGYTKTKWMNVIGFIGISVIFSFLSEIEVTVLSNNMTKAIVSIILSFIIYEISKHVSINIYTKKDF
jgi:hypothetical protein